MTTDLQLLLEKRERSQAVEYDYRKRATNPIHRCNACGGIKSVLLAGHDRYGFEAQFRECNNCGLVWISPRMSKADYADFYENWYRPLLTAWYGESMGPESIIEHQIAYTTLMLRSERLKREFEKHRAGKLLDVGGSTGVVSEMLSDAYKFKATVLDPSSDELAMARGRGLETIHGFTEDLRINQKYDVILMLQTIEHLLDPKGTLQRLRGLLNPGGIMVVDIVPFNEARVKVRPIEQILKIDHPFYLSKYAFDELIYKCWLQARTLDAVTGRHFHYVLESVPAGVLPIRLPPGQLTTDKCWTFNQSAGQAV